MPSDHYLMGGDHLWDLQPELEQQCQFLLLGRFHRDRLVACNHSMRTPVERPNEFQGQAFCGSDARPCRFVSFEEDIT